MKITLSQYQYDTFIFQLLKLTHQAQSSYNFMLNSNHIINDNVLKKILTLHSQMNYSECYSLLIECKNRSNKPLYERLALLLLQLEKIKVIKFITVLNNCYNSGVNRRISFESSQHREKVYECFNLNSETINNGDDEEMLVNEIITLMEYYQCINVGNIDNKHINIALYELLNKSNCGNVNNTITFKSILSFFVETQMTLCYDDEGDNDIEEKKMLMNVNDSFNNNKNSVVNKLNYIYENINNINFDNLGEISIDNTNNKVNNMSYENDVNNNNNNEDKFQQFMSAPLIDYNKQTPTKDDNDLYTNDNDNELYCVKETPLSETDIFLLKLKSFQLLKKYYLYRKSKRPYYQKKQHLLSMAHSFYTNLLKSRVLFAFSLLTKRKTNFLLLKNNYIDFRITELSKLLIHTLLSASLHKQKLRYHMNNKRLKTARILFSILKNKINYKKNYNKFLLSQITHNEYAREFMLMVCDIAKQYHIKKKNTFNKVYDDIVTVKYIGYIKKYFELFFKEVRIMKENTLLKRNTVKQVARYLDVYGFFMKMKRELEMERKVKMFRKKVFFVRYYMWYYYKEKRKEEKKRKRSNIINDNIINKQQY